jgi:hypothetical protein
MVTPIFLLYPQPLFSAAIRSISVAISYMSAGWRRQRALPEGEAPVLLGEFCGWVPRGSSREASPSAGKARGYSSHACAAGILKWQVRVGIQAGTVSMTLPPAPSVAIPAPVRGLVRGRPWAGPCSSVAGSATVRGPRGPRNPAPTDA